jgi:sec-independent protein translocase protein TatA
MVLSVLLLAIAPRTVIFIAVVLLLFFGGKRIPELFRGVGQGVREFKDASKPTEEPRYREQPPVPPVAPRNPNDPNRPIA